MGKKRPTSSRKEKLSQLVATGLQLNVHSRPETRVTSGAQGLYLATHSTKVTEVRWDGTHPSIQMGRGREPSRIDGRHQAHPHTHLAGIKVLARFYQLLHDLTIHRTSRRPEAT